MQLTKLKNPIVIGSVIAGLLLIAGAVYVTMQYMNLNKDTTNKPVAKPKLVAPAKVMTNLKTANDAAKTAHDLHTSTKATFDEQPVKLVK
jgi:uncharacterized iron-regulated membrane protein